jgi:hypothetical protein
MRTISYILVVIGILLLALAGYDEFRGSTSTPSSEYDPSETVTKDSKPEMFRNAMTYHWFHAFMLLGAGGIAYLIDKGQDKVDPMSPDADENIDKELRKDELDEEMKKKEEPHGFLTTKNTKTRLRI